jgi:hypothetical protein
VRHRLATACQAALVTPETLVGAPELAVLALLDDSLRVARLALLAAQPALVGEPPSWRVTPELIAAAQLLRDAATLERSIARYRRCAMQVLHDEPERDDETPF